MDVRLYSQSHTNTATSSPFHKFSLKSNLGSIQSHSQTNCDWMTVHVRHSGPSLSLPGCLQWTEKRGHSVQWSDDWAADTGKKEADRGRNKERERCRSLPNCQWVTTVEHTSRYNVHALTHTSPQMLLDLQAACVWVYIWPLTFVSSSLSTCVHACVLGGACAALTAWICEHSGPAVSHREMHSVR